VERFAEVLQRFAAMPKEQRLAQRERCRAQGLSISKDESAIDDNRRMLHAVSEAGSVQEPVSPWTHLRKFIRFCRIYGPQRAIAKVAGRTRIPMPFLRRPSHGLPAIGVVGCGQFAFSTIAYYLRGKARIRACYDISTLASQSFAKAWRVQVTAETAEAVLDDPAIRLVYIASNHASHAPYAVAALRNGKDVYVEKPVAITEQQLHQLRMAYLESGRRLFAGYNRPHSRAIDELSRYLVAQDGPMTLACIVSGHQLSEHHWYRQPEEGTRICGNVGHWLDLMVHLLSPRSALADRWRVTINWSDEVACDDNLAISLASDSGDLVSITTTSRTEPFEGINESIFLQCGEVIAKIDDFRAMDIWKASRHVRRRYWPKDVGHRRAVLQPFAQRARPWQEVEDSTLLMLHIAEMVKRKRLVDHFSFAEARERCFAGVDRLFNEARGIR